MTAPSFAVVIPMYNEQAGAEKCVRAVCGVIEPLPHRSALIAVNDGSRDGTGEILKRMQPQHPKLTVVNHPENRGYGAALRTGVQQAHREGFDYVLFMDSDLTNDPNDIPKFVAKMEQGIDVIKASRYIPGGRVEGVPLKRAMISRSGNSVARLLFRWRVRDCTNGFRAVRTTVLADMPLHEPGFSIIMEELYHCSCRTRSFCEVPVVLKNRGAAQRATSFGYRPWTLIKYLKYGLLAFFGVAPRRDANAAPQSHRKET